ncbi:isochorismatase family protein [Aquabacterium sp.]|uniref:isochorismatase family protein n=1 Tax=Aquabacterium sp. TaxID=1872578 RepID=UPI0025BF4362|nr:isochorismatase family protein [Aquabacterium sp.]
MSERHAALNTADALHAASSVLVLVDYQGRLMPAIHEGERVSARAVLLAEGARLLGVPVVGTEQNPSRLGPNVDAVKALCDATVAKTHFDACPDGLVDAVQAARPGCTDIVIAGCEAHVCLLQTALGLLRAWPDWRVWVVANASGSRRASDHAAAMARLAQAGANVVTHEMVLFEWLADCRHERFREVLALIKAAD